MQLLMDFGSLEAWSVVFLSHDHPSNALLEAYLPRVVLYHQLLSAPRPCMLTTLPDELGKHPRHPALARKNAGEHTQPRRSIPQHNPECLDVVSRRVAMLNVGRDHGWI